MWIKQKTKLLVSNEPSHFFSWWMPGNFYENIIWEQTYLLFSFLQQDCRWNPAPRCLLFSCFLGGLVWLLGPSSSQACLEHFQPLRSHSRLSGGWRGWWVHHFQGWLRQSECTREVRELQSHFKQGCSAQCLLQILIGVPPHSRETITSTVQLQWLPHCYFNLLLYQGAAPVALHRSL